MHLLVRAFAGLGFLLLLLATALFWPAGTLGFWQAWVFLAVFAAATSAITVNLMLRDPALLARRVQAGPTAERSGAQKLIQSLASLAFLGIFVVSALDRRFGWSSVPVGISLCGDALVALGLLGVAHVFRANTFTSATIEVARDQQVVSTGPYAVIRHPMYAAALIMMIGVPIALGSLWAMLGFPLLCAAVVLRLLDEEGQLSRDLSGYTAYRERVRHRLIPHVW